MGAHHQNGVAERYIQTLTQWACAMMIHAHLHWPEEVDQDLWPLALLYATYLWNHFPWKGHCLAPIEIFTKTKLPLLAIRCARVWGCPSYVLHPRL